MSLPSLTPELVERIERFHARFHADRMSALADLPGNPFGVEVRHFGSGFGVACRVTSPLLRGKNRILGFRAEDAPLLGDLLALYRDKGLRCSLSVVSHGTSYDLFRTLVAADMWSTGSGVTPAIATDGRADDTAPPTPPDIVVRPSPREEKESYLDLFQQAFSQREERTPEYRAFQWAEDSLPGQRYIAEIDGQPVGMASFLILDGVGYCGTAGVLPEFRGRGIQTALIRRRIADAPALGCDLILGGGSPGTTTYKNFERCGLRLVPTGMLWGDVPQA